MATLTPRSPPNNERATLTGQVMATPAVHPDEPVGTYKSPWSGSPVTRLANPRFDVHPDHRPSDLFAVKPIRYFAACPGYRFVRKSNYDQMLLFVDGACAGNGTPQARAGYAICMGPNIVIKQRLEVGPQTNNRAELRAASGALDLRNWRGEGFTSVVITTDSEYVVKGFCKYLPKWKERGWKNAKGADVVNKDIWQELDRKVQSMANLGAHVLFWWIPRAWNEADKYAKEAAAFPDSRQGGSALDPVIFMPY